ncbi:hypothetical protein GGR56DRAFT_613406 [Xylariaceae sp. FL0804]|nr:hypothetical protein GGR56DRAFT_613406 [Xylariaceae sp. FL0804]
MEGGNSRNQDNRSRRRKVQAKVKTLLKSSRKANKPTDLPRTDTLARDSMPSPQDAHHLGTDQSSSKANKPTDLPRTDTLARDSMPFPQDAHQPGTDQSTASFQIDYERIRVVSTDGSPANALPSEEQLSTDYFQPEVPARGGPRMHGNINKGREQNLGIRVSKAAVSTTDEDTKKVTAEFDVQHNRNYHGDQNIGEVVETGATPRAFSGFYANNVNCKSAQAQNIGLQLK